MNGTTAPQHHSTAPRHYSTAEHRAWELHKLASYLETELCNLFAVRNGGYTAEDAVSVIKQSEVVLENVCNRLDEMAEEVV